MKKIIFILMLAMLSSTVFASQCYVGGDCYIYHNVEDAVFDQVFVNVTAENGSVIFTDDMSLQSGTLYFVNHNFEDGGNYTAFIQVLNASIEQSNTTQSFVVLESGGLFTNLCPSTTTTMIALWFFIAFFLVIAIVGFTLPQMFLTLIGGLGITFAGFIAIGCATALGVLTIVTGVMVTILSLLIKT